MPPPHKTNYGKQITREVRSPATSHTLTSPPENASGCEKRASLLGWEKY
jgi:hypothetical protein